MRTTEASALREPYILSISFNKPMGMLAYDFLLATWVMLQLWVVLVPWPYHQELMTDALTLYPPEFLRPNPQTMFWPPLAVASAAIASLMVLGGELPQQ